MSRRSFRDRCFFYVVVLISVVSMVLGRHISPGSAADSRQVPLVQPMATTPSAKPPLEEIGSVVAHPQLQPQNLIGAAHSASQGVVTAKQILSRPLMRTGDVLETIPGVVISQHSGEGKANQYYLRGFNLDHGTDIAGFVVGMPINLPSHAHGQGYSDINWVIPELINSLKYDKGPYDAAVGDFSTAGSYHMNYRDVIPATVSVAGGSFGYNREFYADTHSLGAGKLLYAVEYYHNDGSFDKPDNFQKYNSIIRYSLIGEKDTLHATAVAYSGVFESSDQVPQRLVNAGLLSPYGVFDPSDGGTTHRYAVTSEYSHQNPNGTTSASAYAFHYDLDLFSNLSYDTADASDYYDVTQNPLTCNAQFTTCTPGSSHVTGFTSYCPSNTMPPGSSMTNNGQILPGASVIHCGDQREQFDDRFVTGASLNRTFVTPNSTTQVGLDLRNDNINRSGLYLTKNRHRFQDGTLSDDHVVERDIAAYIASNLRVTSRLNVDPGLRLDTTYYHVASQLAPNSGSGFAALINPKLTVAYRSSKTSELYADFGESFHSNDVRGVVQTIDPRTHSRLTDAGVSVGNVTPMVRAIGSEIGYRYGTPRITATASLWQLHLGSELVFDGDTSQTDPGPPSYRLGLELSARLQLSPVVNIDSDFDRSSAHFTADPEGVGTNIPEAIRDIASLGVTVQKPGYEATLRARYFGPRYLSEDGSAVSQASTLLNAQYTAKMNPRTRLTADVLNILNSHADDVEYSYGSWTPADAQNPSYVNNTAINPALGGEGVNDTLIHRTQKRSFRLVYTLQL